MSSRESPTRQWVKSTIIAGKHNVNKDQIDHSFDYFGGTKIELVMIILRLSRNKLRDKDNKRA